MDPATFQTEFNLEADTLLRQVDRQHADKLFQDIVIKHHYSFDALNKAMDASTQLDITKKYIIEIPPGTFHGGTVLAVKDGTLTHVLCGESDKFKAEDIKGSSIQALQQLASDEGLQAQGYIFPFCAATSAHRPLWRAMSNLFVPFIESQVGGSKEVTYGFDDIVTPDFTECILVAAETEVRHLTKDITLTLLPGAKHKIELSAANSTGRASPYVYDSSLPITTFVITLTGMYHTYVMPMLLMCALT